MSKHINECAADISGLRSELWRERIARNELEAKMNALLEHLNLGYVSNPPYSIKEKSK